MAAESRRMAIACPPGANGQTPARARNADGKPAEWLQNTNGMRREEHKQKPARLRQNNGGMRRAERKREVRGMAMAKAAGNGGGASPSPPCEAAFSHTAARACCACPASRAAAGRMPPSTGTGKRLSICHRSFVSTRTLALTAHKNRGAGFPNRGIPRATAQSIVPFPCRGPPLSRTRAPAAPGTKTRPRPPGRARRG